MNTTVVVALLGIISAVIVAAVNGALASRSRAGEDVRSGRLEAYPLVWELTAVVSRWPRRTLIHHDAANWHRNMRQWYYEAPTAGGMYLSTNARKRYENVQELLSIYLEGVAEDDEPFPDDTYDALANACSEFRSALTEDLQSRRTRSPAWVISRYLIHRKHAARGRARVDAAQKQHQQETLSW